MEEGREIGRGEEGREGEKGDREKEEVERRKEGKQKEERWPQTLASGPSLWQFRIGISGVS